MQTEQQSTAEDGPVAEGVERLDEQHCWSLLQESEIGRLAVRVGDGVDVFPVNFACVEHRIVLRTTHGTKLNALTVHPDVAFEIDGANAGWRWSVVLTGRARTPELMTELQQLRERRLFSYSPHAKSAYVVIDPASVTGRRFLQRLEFDAP